MTTDTQVPNGEKMSLLDELSALHQRALQGGVLDKQTKELVAIAAALASGHETSIAYHLHNALEAGATREAVLETVNVALFIATEPAAMNASQVRKALDELATSSTKAAVGKHVEAVAHPYMTPE
jgi:AhpD family alkylhydroperoxidase